MMIPQEILSQLPPEFPAHEAKSVRLSASPTSSLGESYLLSARGEHHLFVRDSLLSPLVEVPLRGALRLQDGGPDPLLCATTSAGGELKIKVSFLERDPVEAFLLEVKEASTAAVEVEVQALIREAEREAPVVQSAPAAPPRDLSGLSPEALEDLQETLDEEAAEAIQEGDLSAATQKLSALCALPLQDLDDLEEYRKGLQSIAALLKENPREAFFLAGDYDGFYCEYQFALASHLGEALERRGEKLLAAASYTAALDEEEAARLLLELRLSEPQLRQKVIQEALPFLQERLARDPNDVSSLSFLAELFYEEDRDEESLALSLQLIALSPHSRSGYEQAVRAALTLKRPAEAHALAEKARAKCPDLYWVYNLFGEVAEAQGDTRQSREAYEESLRRAPENIDALDGLQKILRRQDDPQALAALLESSLEPQSYKAEQLREELAQLYEGPLKNPAKAKELRRRTREREPGSPEAPATRAAPPGLSTPAAWVIFLIVIALWFIWHR